MIGIIPIGGSAERMNGLPKFLLPVGDSFLLDILIHRMAGVFQSEGGLNGIAIGVRDSNRVYVEPNISRFLSDIYPANTDTMSETVLEAMSGRLDRPDMILFGMPDTYWTDENVYETLLDNLYGAIANVAVWVTPPHHRSKRGMCHTHHNHLLEVIDKPPVTDLTWGWGAMIWTPEFWKYIKPEDLHVGFALQRALDAGEEIRAEHFPGKYYDCGTPDEYYECIIATQGERLENPIPANN